MKTKTEILADLLGVDETELSLEDLLNRHVPLLYVLQAMDAYVDQFKPGWIPVSDILPENDVEVLVYSENESIVGMFTTHGWRSKLQFYDETNDLRDVTHWIPLPEQP